MHKQLEALDSIVALESSMTARFDAAQAKEARFVALEAGAEDSKLGAVSPAPMRAIEGPATSASATLALGASLSRLSASASAAAITYETDGGAGALAAQEVSHHKLLIRQLIREARETPQLLKALNDAALVQAQHGIEGLSGSHSGGLGGRGLRPPAINTMGDSSRIAAGAGIPYMMSFLAAMEDVVEDRLAHTAEELRQRRSDVEDASASVSELTKRHNVEATENGRLAARNRAEERGKASRLAYLRSKLRGYDQEWAAQQERLTVSIGQTRKEQEEAYEEEKTAYESQLAAGVAELEAMRVKHAEEEAASRIKRKRGILEISKSVQHADEALISARRRMDVLQAEISDQDDQIAALEAYLGVVQAEKERRLTETSAWATKTAQAKQRKRLLENGSARLIARNLRMGCENKKEARKASSKDKKKKK
jgi:hypothetical protein